MKNTSKFFSVVAVIIVVTFIFTTSYAQLTDVFSTAFKAIDGFNVSIAHPAYQATVNIDPNKNDFGNLAEKVFNYSVRFAPLRFGPPYHVNVNGIHNKDIRVTLRVAYLATVGGYTPVQYDTVKEQMLGNPPIWTQISVGTYETLLPTAALPPPPPLSPPAPPALQYIQEAWAPDNYLSLNLGYSVTPSFLYADQGGLTADIPISSIFLRAVTRLAPETIPDFVVGLAASFPQLNNVNVKYIPKIGDTTLLKMSSTATIAIELFAGYIFNDLIVHLPEGFNFYIDGGYKFQEFHGLSFTAAQGVMVPINLPSTIIASNLFLRFGIGFNVRT